jgi:Mce-associated membrane protein
VTDDNKNDVTGDEAIAEESSNAVELTEPSEAEEATESGDAAEETADEKDAVRRKGFGRRLTGTAGRNVPVVVVAGLVALALVLSAGLAAWLYFFQYRTDQQTDSAAANVALEAAKNGTVALLSYSPDTLDKDFAAAKSNLTGDFLSYYTQFTQQIVTPAAKQKSVKTAASVVRAAVSEMHPDSAVVLVFINQNTTSKENPDGAFAASAVKVGLKKINDAWLISSFDPV